SKNSRMNSLRISMLGSALACALLVVSPPAAAQMQTFWVDGTGDWFNAANWSAGVPNSNVDAEIDNGGTAQVTAPGAAALDVDLGFNAPSNSGTVTVDGNGRLSIGLVLGVGVNGNGTLSVSNGGVVSATGPGVGNGCTIGAQAASSGTVA